MLEDILPGMHYQLMNRPHKAYHRICTCLGEDVLVVFKTGAGKPVGFGMGNSQVLCISEQIIL